MSQKQKYILDIKLSKEEIKEINKKNTVIVTKDVILLTYSLFWFNRLCQFPKLYHLFHLLPQVKKAPSLFCQYRSLKNKKVEAVKNQDFEHAAALRDRENKVKVKILDQYNINSFKMNHYCVDKNKTNLIVIWIDRT